MRQSSAAAGGECLAFADHRETRIYRDTQHAPFVSVTEIFCFDPSSKKSNLLFSDEKEAAMLRPVSGSTGHPYGYIATSNNRFFYIGVVRAAQRVDQYVEQVGSIFQINLQGQDRMKKVCDIQSAQPISQLNISPKGTKVGYIGYIKTEQHGIFRPVFFVHDSNNGKVLAEIDLRKVGGDCEVGEEEGWVDDNHLVFTTGPGDEHISPADCSKREGRYLVTDDGKKSERLLANDARGQRVWGEASSSDKNYVAYQKETFDPKIMMTDEGLWLKNVHTGQKSQIVSIRYEIKPSTPNDLEHHVGIIGWMP